MAAVLSAGTAIDATALTAQLGAIVGAGATSVLCDVGTLVKPDARAVDALARLQLAARRLGCDLRLERVSTELAQLLDFMGLTEVLCVEVRRQTEEREERLGVKEERELDDPAS
jgi:anti-anti-sigma regulatory factor